MVAGNNDILDLVQTTIADPNWLFGKPTVTLDGYNIMMGDVPVAISDIRAASNSVKSFFSLVKGACK